MEIMQMLMQLLGGGAPGGEQPVPASARKFVEGGRLRSGRVTGLPEAQQEPQMGPQPEGAGLDPEMIRLMMMGGNQ